MKTNLNTISKTYLYSATKQIPNEINQFKDAIKTLSKKFSEIPEIGRFKPINVCLIQPIKNSRIQKASIVIEPSVNPTDFRTRVLTFRTNSPIDESITHEISPAIGNKFSIESALKNPKLTKMFETFIKDSEDILLK